MWSLSMEEVPINKSGPFHTDQFQSDRTGAIFLPPATKLGQGNIFRGVSQEFCRQERWYPSMHLQAHTGGGGFQTHTRGVSRPSPAGSPGPPRGGWWVSQHALWKAPPPPPVDGYCCRRYAPYWNAFLFTF